MFIIILERLAGRDRQPPRGGVPSPSLKFRASYMERDAQSGNADGPAGVLISPPQRGTSMGPTLFFPWKMTTS